MACPGSVWHRRSPSSTEAWTGAGSRLGRRSAQCLLSRAAVALGSEPAVQSSGWKVHYPQRAERIMARVHDMRGGKDYDSDFTTA